MNIRPPGQPHFQNPSLRGAPRPEPAPAPESGDFAGLLGGALSAPALPADREPGTGGAPTEAQVAERFNERGFFQPGGLRASPAGEAPVPGPGATAPSAEDGAAPAAPPLTGRGTGPAPVATDASPPAFRPLADRPEADGVRPEGPSARRDVTSPQAGRAPRPVSAAGIHSAMALPTALAPADSGRPSEAEEPAGSAGAPPPEDGAAAEASFQLSLHGEERNVDVVARVDQLTRDERRKLQSEVAKLLSRFGFAPGEIRLNGQVEPPVTKGGR